MSVIQETIDNLVGGANHFDRIGYPLAAGVNRTLAAKLSEYADITEARAAGFATVEEMTHMMGRSSTQSVPDFLNAQHDKAANYDEIVAKFSEDGVFKTDWNGDAVWYAKELYDEYDLIAAAVRKHGDIGEDFGTGDVGDAVERRLEELTAIRQAIADTDEENNRTATSIPGDHATLAEFVGRLNTFVNNVTSAIEDTAGHDPIRSDDDPTANSLKKSAAYAVRAIEAYAAKPPIPIADLDKHTIKDGEVVRSEQGEFVGIAQAPVAAEVVAIRVHEELDDVAPPPTDAQVCTAHLLNYLDAKFKESSELAFKLDEESTCRDQRLLDRIKDLRLSGRDIVFLVVWTASIVAAIKYIVSL
jgi:hypothetical protein